MGEPVPLPREAVRPLYWIQETYESLVDTSGLAETFAVRQRTLQEYVRPVVEWVPPEQH